MRRLLIPLAAVGLATATAIPAALAGGRPMSTDLSGTNEAPAPGDPDGTGHAKITLNQGQGEVCFDITVEDIGTVILAHIHRAPVGSPGPVVVDFNFPTNGLNGCVAADPALVKEIRKNPSAFYVNVHTTDFPAGAVRGQL